MIQQQPSRVTALQQPQDQPAALSLSATISQYIRSTFLKQFENDHSTRRTDKIKRPLLEFVRRDAILQCDDSLVN